MKSDVIRIDNQGGGFRDAVDQTRRTAEYRRLSRKDSLHLQLLAEEMLSLIRSVTGEVKASFWIEGDDDQLELHVCTETVMDKAKRDALISAASSKRNDAARGVLGRLREAFEKAMLSDVNQAEDDAPEDLLADLPGGTFGTGDWDGYERSVVKKLADWVRISIRGGVVDMAVSYKAKA